METRNIAVLAMHLRVFQKPLVTPGPKCVNVEGLVVAPQRNSWVCATQRVWTWSLKTESSHGINYQHRGKEL